MDLKQHIRDIPDFPEPGILFKDITPLLQDPEAFQYAVDCFAEHYQGIKLDSIVAVESRGFIFGAPLAYRLGKPLIPARKQGKLPGETYVAEYTLEYGSSIMEMHTDGVNSGDQVLLLDDLLATGGTLAATAKLVDMAGGEVIGAGLLIELSFLDGRSNLGNYDVFSLIKY